MPTVGFGAGQDLACARPGSQVGRQNDPGGFAWGTGRQVEFAGAPAGWDDCLSLKGRLGDGVGRDDWLSLQERLGDRMGWLVEFADEGSPWDLQGTKASGQQIGLRPVLLP